MLGYFGIEMKWSKADEYGDNARVGQADDLKGDSSGGRTASQRVRKGHLTRSDSDASG